MAVALLSRRLRRLCDVESFQRRGGQTFTANTADPESLRLNPATGNLLWPNEGQRSAAGLHNPSVREMTAAGAHLRDLSVPARFMPAGSAAGTAAGGSGIRNNLAFESLTLSTDGRTLYTATENALVRDGAAASTVQASPSRFPSFALASGNAGAGYLYNVAPVVLPPKPAGGLATNAAAAGCYLRSPPT